MNTKIIAYIVVIIVVAFGLFFVLRPSQNQTMQMPTNQNQESATNQPTATAPSGATSTTAVVVSVSIHNFAFQPQSITIHQGDTVVWTNNDSVGHQIVGGPINGPVISNGQTYSFTFNTTGTFDYHCAIHPSMTGTIVVQ